MTIFKETKLKNTSDNLINPATEENQTISFNLIQSFVNFILDAIHYPTWTMTGVYGQQVRARIEADSNMNNVASVSNVTSVNQFNGMDSKLVFWQQLDQTEASTIIGKIQ